MAVTTPASLMRSALAALVVFVSGVAGYSGEGTAYASAGGRGLGACGIRHDIGRFETYFAAMNNPQYDGSVCGKCVKVRGARGTIVAMVVDRCMGCKSGDLDLSSNGLEAITGKAWDREPISWEFTDCDGVSSQSRSRKGGKKGGKGGGKKKCKKGRRGRKCRRSNRRGLLLQEASEDEE